MSLQVTNKDHLSRQEPNNLMKSRENFFILFCLLSHSLLDSSNSTSTWSSSCVRMSWKWMTRRIKIEIYRVICLLRAWTNTKISCRHWLIPHSSIVRWKLSKLNQQSRLDPHVWFKFEVFWGFHEPINNDVESGSRIFHLIDFFFLL